LRQYLYYHPEHRNTDSVKRRIDRLMRKGDCDQGSGRGQQVIRFSKKLPGFVAPARFGKKARGRLVVDDKATYVVISEDLAESAGLSGKGERITMTTNSGVYHGQLALAESIQVGNLRATGVQVLIADAVPAEVDGLLGLSFVARFQMKHYPGKRIVLKKRSRFTLGDALSGS
jgi:aspartyl protease family protein